PVPRSFCERMEVFPCLHVQRPVQQHRAALLREPGANREIPCVAVLPAEWVAETRDFQAGRWTVDDRLVTLLPRPEVIVHRGCDTLNLTQTLRPDGLLLSRDLRDTRVDDACPFASREYAS